MVKAISGDKLKSIEEYERIKSILTDFLRGYPSWRYYGIFEFYFKERAESIIKRLEEDEFIKVSRENGTTFYWLTQKGVQLASSFSTRKRIDAFKWIAVVLGLGTLIFAFAQCIISLWF